MTQPREIAEPTPEMIEAGYAIMSDPNPPCDYKTLLGRAYAAMRSAAPVADGWRDIESAPKDGTSILAAVRGWHPQRPTEGAYYVTAARWLWSNDAREPHENYPDDGAFFELNNDWADTWGGNIGPTHWQPLPEPPVADGEKQS